MSLCDDSFKPLVLEDDKLLVRVREAAGAVAEKWLSLYFCGESGCWRHKDTKKALSKDFGSYISSVQDISCLASAWGRDLLLRTIESKWSNGPDKRFHVEYFVSYTPDFRPRHTYLIRNRYGVVLGAHTEVDNEYIALIFALEAVLYKCNPQDKQTMRKPEGIGDGS